MAEKYAKQRRYIANIRNDPLKWAHHLAVKKERDARYRANRKQDKPRYEAYKEREKTRARENRQRHKIIETEGKSPCIKSFLFILCLL